MLLVDNERRKLPRVTLSGEARPDGVVDNLLERAPAFAGFRAQLGRNIFV
jgi:hypothetical protein